MREPGVRSAAGVVTCDITHGYICSGEPGKFCAVVDIAASHAAHALARRAIQTR